jgi:lipopolysaccharide/colanic/teichoic acid biosynthesis glycosyltransferase
MALAAAFRNERPNQTGSQAVSGPLAWTASLPAAHTNGTPRAKRLLDLALVVPALPACGAATAAMALSVRLVDGPPAFFPQQRLGRRGRRFRIYKLRTMTADPDPADRRPTPLGRWLRQRGLDELPQVLNVLLGDMSLVGPRPLTPETARRLVARHPPFAAHPGITGLAQVCLARGPEVTARLEAAYTRHRSTAGDLAILMRTLWINAVGKRRGARRPPEPETAP